MADEIQPKRKLTPLGAIIMLAVAVGLGAIAAFFFPGTNALITLGVFLLGVVPGLFIGAALAHGLGQVR